MKTTFALLLGLLLLESCAKPISVREEVYDVGVLDDLQKVCAANDGIYVILIDYTANASVLTCSDIKGKKITKKLKPDPGLTPGDQFSLGEIAKHKANKSDSDPCIRWSLGGTPTYYCW